MLKVELYSDGSARGNPGPGGYGTLLRYRDPSGHIHEKEFTEGYFHTTNNRMELMGLICGLEALKCPCEVHVTSDSQYVISAFEQHWLENWQAHNWKTAGKKPVKNKDLWERLLRAAQGHVLNFTWVKGHNGHPENERCDELAFSSASTPWLHDEGCPSNNV